MTAPSHPTDAALDGALEFLGERVLRDHPLGPLTTYRVGGHAARFVEVADADELVRIAEAVASVRRSSTDRTGPESAVPLLVVGKGSNLLVAERGLPGLVVQLGERFATVEIDPDGTPDGAGLVIAGGAASLPVVARRTVAAGLTGFEWAVGVPGSIGGAVRMNAGGHGSEMAAVLARVRVVDLATGEDVLVDATSLELGYRRSTLSPSQVVVRAELRLQRGERSRGEAELSDIVRWRRENQPGGQNAGSVFTNPEGDSAGRLIEAAGCKGLRVGTAQVSDKHANFIQADPEGSSDDVLALMHQVVDRVERNHGVRLHPETVLVGFDEDEARFER